MDPPQSLKLEEDSHVDHNTSSLELAPTETYGLEKDAEVPQRPPFKPSQSVSSIEMDSDADLDRAPDPKTFLKNELTKQNRAILMKVKKQWDKQKNMIKLINDLDPPPDENKESETILKFSTMVVPRLIDKLRNAWPIVRKTLAEVGIEAELNLVKNTMTIVSTPDMNRDLDMLKAKDLLKLLARGFPFEQAMLVMRDEFKCVFIKIGANIGTKEEFHKRRSRLIGPEGWTLKTIELLTGCYIFIRGDTACVLGRGYEGINVAGEIILDSMKKVHPISHIRRLVIMKELEKRTKLKKKDWVRFLPPIYKNPDTLLPTGRGRGGNIDFLLDHPSQMTTGRIIALYLMKFNWYYPQIRQTDEEGFVDTFSYTTESKGSIGQYSSSSEIVSFKTNLSISNEAPPPPSLKAAWAFFEHNVLPRHAVDEEETSQTFFRRLFTFTSRELKMSEPGDDTKQSTLYSIIFTPLKEMGDFGLGVGLYFETLRSLFIMMFIAGLISLPSMSYYVGREYSPSKLLRFDDTAFLYVSAVCLDHEFVPCRTCVRDRYKPEAFDRYGEVVTNGVTLTFARRNSCDRDGVFRNSLINWFAIVFLSIGILLLNRRLVRKGVEFDLNEQTAQDYSITVDNPPRDATDPDEWKKYFERVSGGHVTVCTVGLDNDFFLNTLIRRRVVISQIRKKLERGHSFHDQELAKLAATTLKQRTILQKIIALFLHPFGIGLDLPALYSRYNMLTSKIRGLSQLDYPAAKVFVTFETEKAQRRALSSLSVAGKDLLFKKSKKLTKKQHFRGIKVLRVSEANEPSTIRWQQLNATFTKRLRTQAITNVIAAFFISASFFLVFWIHNTFGIEFAAYAITILNSVVPTLTKVLIQMEYHTNETTRQASLYIKLTIFRWLNTAIIFIASTPFTSTVTAGDKHLLQSIDAIFIADIWVANTLQFLNIPGIINRHIRGPRAKTQQEMNNHFKGSAYELAERYTNATKSMFLALFYCAVYPGGFFLCAISLFINYFLDSYSLMRTWTPAPKSGTAISNMSRKYFFTLALFITSVVSAYFWGSFPFDNLCPVENVALNETYFGDHNITTFNTVGDKLDEIVSVRIGPNHTEYRHCDQNFFAKGRFPFLKSALGPDELWMTPLQERSLLLHGVTSFIGLCVILMWFAYDVMNLVRSFFYPSYEPSGEDQGKDFSKIEYSISGYIPQIVSNFFAYPILACDVKGIGEELYDWKDTENDFEYHSLCKDVEEILGKRVLEESNVIDRVFSKVRHWDPHKKTHDDDDD